MRSCYFSYPLTRQMPVYGGSSENLQLSSVQNVELGDSCNTWRICLENHWGTHIDTPNHFFSNGQKIVDYPANFLVFKKPQVLDVGLEPGEMLRWNKISANIDKDADFLILKSGWGKDRGSDLYWKENPGIHADIAMELRNLKSSIRALGIDWISVSSFLHRKEGRETHRVFLDPEGKGNPILIVEDMDLSGDLTNLSKVLIAPLRVEQVDSAPCTIIGFCND